MIINNKYLSDEQLKSLIAEAEADLVTAPPAVKEQVIMFLQNEEDKAGRCPTHMSARKSEFLFYCLRVSLAMASSIVMIFILSYWETAETNGENLYLADETISKEMFLNMMREERFTDADVKEHQQIKECPSKEEVLNDTNLLYKIVKETADKTNERKISGGE